MEVVMSKHRFVLTDRLWHPIAPLLPGKATDRALTVTPVLDKGTRQGGCFPTCTKLPALENSFHNWLFMVRAHPHGEG